MGELRILIDADACPVTQSAIDIAFKHNIEVLAFCDVAHELRLENAQVITVDTGSDSVDFAIVVKTQKNDIVITQDYGLASLVLAKGVYAMNQNGMQYTPENIDTLLAERHMHSVMRRAGVRGKNIPKRTREQDEKFEKKFEHLILEIKEKGE